MRSTKKSTESETKLSSVLGLVPVPSKVRGEDMPLNRSVHHAAAFVQKSAAKNAVPGNTYI